ncbi:MAG TPA: tetratricopeptide repeat protein [Chthoniobacteraceae bacterium]|jgi:tetratricopeptide (TPR) repeat protein
MLRAVVLSLVIGLLLPKAASAHGDLHEQIEQLTANLKRDPTNAELLLKRADLHRAHGDFSAAAADYDLVQKRAPDLHAVHLGRGKLLLAMERLEAAEAALDHFLAASPPHVEGLLARARVRTKWKAHASAARDFAAAIKVSPRPEPEQYLEHAEALVAAGDRNIDEALRVLDAGMAKLGLLPTLGLFAIKLEVKQGAFDPALERIERLSAGTARKESWLERRGDVLQAAGRSADAHAAYRAAIENVDLLPTHLKQKKATIDLRERLQQKLNVAD